MRLPETQSEAKEYRVMTLKLTEADFILAMRRAFLDKNLPAESLTQLVWTVETGRVHIGFQEEVKSGV